MYKFAIEKCDYINEDECDICPILEESPLELKDALEKVLDFAAEHPDGRLISSDSSHLVEYEIDGAELACYVTYLDDSEEVI